MPFKPNDPSGQANFHPDLKRRSHLPNPASSLAVVGAIILLVAYSFPIRGGEASGSSYSLLFGLSLSGHLGPLHVVVFTALRPLGILSLVLIMAMWRVKRSWRLFPAGALAALGLSESLNFVSLLGTSAALSATAWLGLLGSLVVFVGGSLAFIRIRGQVTPSRGPS